MKIALKYIRFSIFSFYPFEFFVSSASTCQCSSLARPTDTSHKSRSDGCAARCGEFGVSYQ